MNTRAMGGHRPGRGGVAAVLLAAGLAVTGATALAQDPAPGPGTTPDAPKAETRTVDRRPAGLAALADRAQAGTSGWETLAASFGGAKAATNPSRDAVMQFTQNSEVREVLAKGGMRVKRGDVLVRARDAEVVAAIESQKLLAANDLEVQAGEKQAELALFKFTTLKGSKNFSPTEYEQSRIESEVARVQAEQAKKNLEQQVVKLKQLQGQYERYYLEAPFDGVIEEVMVEVGQGVTEQEKVLRIVNTEKLWLDPYADTGETIRLKLREGSPAWVLVDLPDEPRVVRGSVVYVSPVADSVSQTRRVRVEIDNPEGWPAGTQARVRFTEPTGEWKSRVPAGGATTPGGGVSAAEPAAGTAVARTEGPAK